MKPLLLFSTPVLAVLVLIFGVVVVLAPGSPPAVASAACLPEIDDSVSGVDLDKSSSASPVWSSVSVRNLTCQLAAGLLAAGMQESGLRPLNYGDRDSIGVFQQRTAWGSYEERINPTSSASMFYTGGRAGQPGLLDITDWEDLPITEAAQAVQVSAYPDANAKWEQLAIPSSSSSPTSTTPASQQAPGRSRSARRRTRCPPASASVAPTGPAATPARTSRCPPAPR